MADEHRFRLRRGDFEVEIAGSREFVEAQLAQHGDRWARLAGDAEAAPAPAAAPFPRVAPDFQPKVNVSAAQFVSMKEAKLPADVFIVGVYYLEKYQRRETFALDQLQALLAEVPAWDCQRAEDLVEEALVRGHVEKLRDGTYAITFKGQNYVREGLS